jgi:hypothetical protein
MEYFLKVVTIQNYSRECNPPPLSVEFHGHGGTAHDLARLGGFWRAIFQESPEINGSNGTAHDCPCHTEINGNLRILNEITGKLVTLNIRI